MICGASPAAAYLECIEDDLLAALNNLSQETAPVGVASNGAARGILTKVYLNTRQWQEAAGMAQGGA